MEIYSNLSCPRPDGTAVPILVDNQGAIKVAKNDSSSTRTIHIDIQYHFVRDSLSKKLFKIDYCPTNGMTADLLTKPLQRLLITRFKQDLGLTKIRKHWSMCHRGSVENSVTASRFYKKY